MKTYRFKHTKATLLLAVAVITVICVSYKFLPEEPRHEDVNTGSFGLKTGVLPAQCNLTQAARSGHLHSVCGRINTSLSYAGDIESWRKQAWTTVVLEKHRAVACLIPKVATSSWKYKLLTDLLVLQESDYFGKDTYRPDDSIQDVLASHGIRPIVSYSPDKAKHILDNYYKFLFVRDPADRLLSAYKSKIAMAESGNKYYRKMAVDIYKKYSPAKESILTHLPSFEQFMHFITEGNPQEYDQHWKRFSDICNPCGIEYDFIGKMESMNEDVGCLLPVLGMNTWFPYPADKKTPPKVQLPFSLQSKFFAMYAPDFQLFSYNKTSFLLN